MLRTIIIEDEINVREALIKLLRLIDNTIEVIATTGHIEEAKLLIQQHKPQLVFLDIELEDGTGFDLLQQLGTIDFKLIFTTAYNQYAIKAFKFSAIDYLLKPIDPTELSDAVRRAKSEISTAQKHQELIEVLNNNISKKEEKIVLKTTEQRYVIFVKDIIRLEADGAYTLFVTANNSIIVSKHLKFYENLLNDNFIRCHQSHLVNKNHIIGIDKNNILLLTNEEKVPVSTRKKSEVIKYVK